MQARLGTLTREYKVLSGAELISLGVRDCTEKRILVAKAAPAPEDKNSLAKIMQGMKSALLTGAEASRESIGAQSTAPAVAVKTQPVTSPQSAPGRNKPRFRCRPRVPSHRNLNPPTCRCRRAGRPA